MMSFNSYKYITCSLLVVIAWLLFQILTRIDYIYSTLQIIDKALELR